MSGTAPQTTAEPVAEVTYSVTDGLTVRWLRIPKPGDKLYASPHQAASPAPAAEHMADLLRRAEDYLDTGDDERAGHIIADLVAALLAAHSVDGPLPPQRVAE